MRFLVFGHSLSWRLHTVRFTLGAAGLLCLLLFLLPWSPSTQPSGFSLTLDLDDAVGDQAVSSLDLLPDEPFSIQVFGADIQGTTRISARLRFDASQVAYEGIDLGDALPNAHAVAQHDSSWVSIGVSSLTGSAAMNTGWLGTVRFRTTAAFSDTEIWFVDAELARGGQTETISPAIGVALQVAPPPSPDFDGDGVVSFSDFVAFAGVFGSQRGDGRYVAAYDLNGNGGIGFDDFVVFASNFGKNPNRAPSFGAALQVARTVEENTPSGQPIGDPVTATDADGNSLTYRLRGVHADSFAIEPGTGQLLTSEGTAYDHEAMDRYSVTIRASDGQGGRATVVVGITVKDVDEPPSAAPDSVRVASRHGALDVTWTAAMDEAGKPPVSGYEAGHKLAEAQVWPEGLQVAGRTDTGVTLAGLTNEQAYHVRVRTVNDEGSSPWSASVAGAPTAGLLSHGVYGDVTIGVDSVVRVNLASLFTRPALGTLTYGATSSDEGVATVTVADTLAVVRGVATGRATLTATARDVYGNSAQTTFAVVVTTESPPPPPPPLPLGVFGDLIVNVDQNVRVNLASLFTRPALGTLTYGATSSDEGVATVTVADTLAVVRGVAEGRATLTFMAGDVYGNSAQTKLGVVVTTSSAPPQNNRPPSFDDGSATSRTVAENTPARRPIQHPVRATDPDDDRVTYRLSGPDSASFAVDTGTGQLRTLSGITYDFEDNDRYSIILEGSDPFGESATIGVTVHVSDVDEPPEIPVAPVVQPASTTSLAVTWDAPDNTGPDITDYDVQYRKSGSFLPHSHDGPGTSATILDLDVNTRYEVQVRATNDEGTSQYSRSGFGTTSSNLPPVFDEGTSATREVAENTTGVQDIGAPLRATDPENTVVSYRLSHGDTESFDIDTNTGQLQTVDGVNYDFETKDRYTVTVEAQDEHGGRATISVTIDVTDDDSEDPEAPGKPTVTAQTLNSLSIRWTAPVNTGPAVNDYDVQYSEDGGAFTDWPHTGPGTTATITSLTADTPYRVQVLARSPEGESSWSESADARTVANRAPTFNEGTSTTRTLAENSTGTSDIGNPLTARDTDGGTLSYDLEGTDRDAFALDGAQLQTLSGQTYDFEAKPRYEVTVRVEDGQGGSNTIEVTINLTDLQEKPGRPDAPGVSAASSTSLEVTWDEPANTGPDINDFDVQYRQGDSGGFTSWTHNSAERSATITGRTPGTSYQVQVLARSPEGASDWSEPGTGSTDANGLPVFTDGGSATRALDENTTGVNDIGAPLRATDPENTVVSYRLSHGDTESFDIDTNTGQLQTVDGVNYDFETKDRYTVTVEAQDEHGGRATISVTIDVTDDDSEDPEAPGKPTVTAQTLNSLSIRWTAPVNTGPAVNDYDVQYSEDGGAFTDWPHTGPGTTATITSLTADTPYRVQVLARSPEGESSWSESADARTVANRAPTFNEGTSTTRTLAENSTGTSDIGNPLTARDTDGGTLSYDLEGTDRDAFALDGAQLQTLSGQTYDFEAKPRYEVTVRVEDGQGGSNTIEVTINLTDLQEKPGRPDAPGVSAASSTSLEVTWDEPANTGPDINDFDVQYRQGDSGGFTSWTHNSAERSATITGRTPGTSYQVQVLARSPEGASDWSEPGTGSTDANGLPVFTDGGSATRALDENTTGVNDIGDPIGATDPEMTTLTYALEGTHADSFSIDTRSGQLKTRSGKTYDYEATPRFSVNVKATDGHGGERSIPVSIDLNDLNEAPVFTSGTAFEASENHTLAGRVTAEDLDSDDDITDYTLTGGADQGLFEINSAGTLAFKENPDFESPSDAGRNRQYNVAVTATGGAGGRALTARQSIAITLTDENEPPVFTIEDTFKVTENTRFAGRMEAQDVDAGDVITGYAVTGAADGDLFEIASTNQLRFKEDPDFETPADAGSNNDYSVVVEATGGSGARELPGTKTVVVLVEDDVEPPGKPDPPTVSEETESSLTVTWTAPDNTGPDITNYFVQYREGASGAFTDWPETGPSQSRTITDVSSGRIYRIQVQAQNDEGKGPWSDVAYGLILPAPVVSSPTPAFTPAPDEDHVFDQPATHSYSGDYTSTLDPGDHTRTHVKYDDGTLEPAADTPGINISNSITGSEYHAITIGADAEITANGSYAANITTEGNSGNLQILNQGSVTLDKSGTGIRAVMKASPGNVLLVNDGDIRLNGFTTTPESAQSNHRLVAGSLNKAAEPHDFLNYSHKVELFNMPGGQLIATGPYNERVDGLKSETGSGHLTRLVNYEEGLIRIEGEGARGISAQSLWGASQGLNFGSIEINGLFAIGLHTGNCSPWPFANNGCHGTLDEIVPDRTSNVPGDVYARNFSDASITTRATTRTDDTRRHRRGYGIIARSSMSGRVFAINQGTIDTEGKWSHGIYAYGYDNDRDLDDTSYPDIPDYPDTWEHDGVHVENTGTISTDGEAAHGIRAEHYRGGEIKVFNTGNILATSKHSRAAESTWSAGISIAAMGADVPGPGCETAAGDPVDPDIDCASVYRVGNVLVRNNGDIGAPEGVAEAPSIGIDVVSEGGDITITHDGSITAARIGIRVRTTGQGRITLHVNGALNAPTKYEVIGGTDNEIVVNEL